MQKNNIQHIYIGINTIFVEDGVDVIESITYVEPYEDKKNWRFTPLDVYTISHLKRPFFI